MFLDSFDRTHIAVFNILINILVSDISCTQHCWDPSGNPLVCSVGAIVKGFGGDKEAQLASKKKTPTPHIIITVDLPAGPGAVMMLLM